MRRMMLLALVSLSSPSAFTQEADVLGWQDTRWGMTSEQAASALKGEARVPQKPTIRGGQGDKLTCSLEVPALKIGSLELVAYLCFRDNSLALVVLSEDEPTTASFDVLHAKLVEKYGAPTTSERTDIGRKRLWRFKSSMVSLTELIGVRLPRQKQLIFVSVGYEPVVPNKL